jgi:signal transduction histidine kinase
MPAPHDQPARAEAQRLLPYVADLELEVDRLRRHGRVIRQEAKALIRQIKHLDPDRPPAGESPAVGEAVRAAKHLAEVLRDLEEAPGYHPAHDQVVAVAVRPLIEQVFRWQRRLHDAPGVKLALELECEHVEWFPARLRHVLDCLLSNAVKYRDPDKAESWVSVRLRAGPKSYEIRVSDNGVGMEEWDRDRLFDLLYRAAPVRAGVLGVGLAVVKLLVEQSGGELTVDSAPGQGSTFVATLPRYDVDDFLV